jgi:hypothetical protein
MDLEGAKRILQMSYFVLNVMKVASFTGARHETLPSNFFELRQRKSDFGE